jgi:hypothetical protein
MSQEVILFSLCEHQSPIGGHFHETLDEAQLFELRRELGILDPKNLNLITWLQSFIYLVFSLETLHTSAEDNLPRLGIMHTYACYNN